MVKVRRMGNIAIRSLGEEWRLLAEVVTSQEPDQKLLAIKQVLEMVQTFRLSTRRMELLETAVSRAVMNEVGLIGQGSEQSVMIRVMASPQAIKARDHPQNFEVSGWGYFLIEKMGEEAWLRGETFCHTVELFLYLEGEIRNRWKEKE